MLIAMYEPGIDLIVVNYKTPDDLVAFCESYIDNFPEVESTLYIVCNEVTDADTEAVQAILPRIPGKVKFFPFEENLYYSGAANVVGGIAQRETLAILNADTRFMPNTIDLCYHALMDNPNWGTVGPLQVDEFGKVTHGGIFGTQEAPKHRGWHKKMSDQYRDVNEDAVTISGSAYFTKRSVWDELSSCEIYRELYPDVRGPFLPTTHYYEETWFSYHAQAHGYKCVYFGSAEMIHRWHKASVKGGWADQQMNPSRKMFREACDHHGIPRD
jgi:GT2 family glycosyltransferase